VVGCALHSGHRREREPRREGDNLVRPEREQVRALAALLIVGMMVTTAEGKPSCKGP